MTNRRTPPRAAAAAAALAAAVLALGACGAADGVSRVSATLAKAPVEQVKVVTPVAWPAVDSLVDVPVADRPAEEGVRVASLRVPRWGEDYEVPITEGITDHILDTMGMGRFPWSEMPGQEGNFALAGHRTDASRPLAQIDTLELGDELLVTTDLGTYTYAVSGTEIVTPDQVRVVEPNPATGGEDPVGRLLTLVSCHPWDSSEFRYIVYAELSAFEAA
ncbi:sortase [Georgenia wangjunii]|uniref:sortase n=1 Tax=Georgenia wangjunii TaxID=3117730 RepID=UPI002F265ADD